MTRRVFAHRLLLIAVIAASVVPRLFSVGWNGYLHGDVGIDASATASMVAYGKLLVFEERTAAVVPDTAPLPLPEEATILAQHGPLWPLLSAPVLKVRGVEATIAEAYHALQLMSFLSGVLLLVLAWILARRCFDERDALWVVAILGACYVLIDYSANGSFYMLQAALYLFWILIADASSGFRKAVGLGIVGGLAYLLNFQSIVLLLAGLFLVLLDDHPSSIALPHHRFSARIALSLFFVAAFLFAVSPWLIRNALVFGDPLWSHAVNSNYLYIKAGMAHLTEGTLGAVTEDTWADRWRLAQAMLSWLPQNGYYIARKLFVLLPVTFLLFPFALIDAAFRPAFRHRYLPLIVVLLLHVFISIAWPVPKFRYFVPLVPLALLFIVAYMHHLRLSRRLRDLLYGLSLVAMIVVSIAALRSSPTHTSYYDGAVTTDPFSAQGEIQYLRDNNALIAP